MGTYEYSKDFVINETPSTESPASDQKKIIECVKIASNGDLFAATFMNLYKDDGFEKALQFFQSYPDRFPQNVIKIIGFAFLYGEGVQKNHTEAERLLRFLTSEEKIPSVLQIKENVKVTTTLPSSPLPESIMNDEKNPPETFIPVDPERVIFDNIQDQDVSSLQEWIDNLGPYANLEAKHPQYNLPLLYHAARSQNMKAVKLLLEKKANINSQESPVRSTALHISSYLGYGKITKLFLECKANPYLRNRHGETSIENGQNGKNPNEMRPIYQEYCEKFGDMEISDTPMPLEEKVQSLASLDYDATRNVRPQSSNINIPSIITPSMLDLSQEWKQVHDWSIEDTYNWFKHNKIPCHLEKIREDSIDGNTLLSFNETELQQYVMGEEPKRNVAKFIEEHQPRWPTEPEKLWELGISYANGKNVPQNFKTACKLFQMAVNHGHPNALNSLGFCYMTGQGVPTDYKEAIRLYRLAAQKKNIFAAYNLGTIYKKGKMLSQDFKASFEYYKIAADQGHLAAQYNVGNFYLSGSGVEKNEQEAIRYFRMAQEQGENKSKKFLDSIEKPPTIPQENILPQQQQQQQQSHSVSPIPNLNTLTLIDIFRFFGVHDTCSPCTETLKAFFTIHRQCQNCPSAITRQTLPSSPISLNHFDLTQETSPSIISNPLKTLSLNDLEFNIEWTIADVCKWLEKNNLDHYIDKFKEHKIDGKKFKNLVDFDLQQIGVKNSLDHRFIIKYIDNIQKQIQIKGDPPTNERKTKELDPTLRDFLPSVKTKNWQERLSIAIDIAHDILILHENKEVYGNICLQNISLQQDKWKLIQNREQKMECEWPAPELILVKNISSKEADIFAFSFILYSLWIGEIPWQDLSKKSICDQLCGTQRPEFIRDIPQPDHYSELINKCWHPEAKARVTIQVVLTELKQMLDNVTPLLEALLVASNLPQGLEKYKIIKFISSTFTCLIQDKATGQMFAMKIRKTLISPDRYEEEHKLLIKLSHQFLIQFQEGFLWDFQGDWGMKWCLVYNYYEKGTLQANIVTAKERKTITQKGIKKDECQIIDWISQLCEGLIFLHEQGIVHQNVKSSKIFLDQYNIAKLGDIGFTKYLAEEEKCSTMTKDTNITALGVILLELLTLTVGINEFNFSTYLSKIPPDFSSDWKDVVQGLFETNPFKKWTLNQLTLALRDMRNLLVSTLQGDEAAIDSLLNMARVVTLPSNEKPRSGQEPPAKKQRPNVDVKSSQAKKNEGKFQCDYPGCTKAYGKKYTLNRHKKTHLASSAYVCRWCSKPFVDNSSLTRHERSHSGWKPYQCPYQLTCGKRFAESNNLKQHIMRMHDGIFHTEESRYVKTNLQNA